MDGADRGYGSDGGDGCNWEYWGDWCDGANGYNRTYRNEWCSWRHRSYWADWFNRGEWAYWLDRVDWMDGAGGNSDKYGRHGAYRKNRIHGTGWYCIQYGCHG